MKNSINNISPVTKLSSAFAFVGGYLKREFLGYATSSRAASLSMACAAALLVSCGVNQIVPAGEAALEGRGASYYLPRTMVVATVPIVKTSVIKPKYPLYSRPLLKIAPRPSGTPSFAIGKEVGLDLVGVRDPACRFIALSPRGPFKTFSHTLALNDQGVLSKGDAMVENKTVEFAVSTIEAAAKIARSVISPASAGAPLFPQRPALAELVDHLNELDKFSSAVPPKLTVDGLRAGLHILLSESPEAALEQGLKNTDNLVKASLENWISFTEHRPLALSELVGATTAYKLMAKTNESLERATVAADRAALAAERDKLLAQFIGGEKETTWIGVFRWTPPSRNPKAIKGLIRLTQLLFTLDENGGPKFSLAPFTPPSSEFLGKATSGGSPYGLKSRAILQFPRRQPRGRTSWWTSASMAGTTEFPPPRQFN